MKASGVLLLALASVLAVSVTNVQAAIIEVPDELLNEGVFIREVNEDSVREKRQVQAFGGGSEHGGSIRLDGRRNLYDNGRTSVDGKGSYQLDYARGMKPHHSGGIGAEVSHNVWKGRGGQSLDLTAGYQRNFHTPDRHNANVGLRYRFK